MKKLFITAALLLSLAATAQVHEEQERLNQEQPVVTDGQVQRDAKRAAEVREANENLPDNERQLKKQQAKDMRANKKDAQRPAKNEEDTNAAPAKKKSSNKPKNQ